MRACATVHAVRPAAADGFSVKPSGSVIDAVLTCDCEFAVGSSGSDTEVLLAAYREWGR